MWLDRDPDEAVLDDTDVVLLQGHLDMFDVACQPFGKVPKALGALYLKGVTPFDHSVRAEIYALFAGGADRVDVGVVAKSGGWDESEVAMSFRRLADEHRVALIDDGNRVWMAHPFSGVPTTHRAVAGDRSWFANCAWDALAILSMLGDGEAIGESGLVWKVRQGVVTPDGLVRLVVPARHFWDDIGFT